MILRGANVELIMLQLSGSHFGYIAGVDHLTLLFINAPVKALRDRVDSLNGLILPRKTVVRFVILISF